MEEQVKPVWLSDAWEEVEIFFLPCRLIFVQKFPFRETYKDTKNEYLDP